MRRYHTNKLYDNNKHIKYHLPTCISHRNKLNILSLNLLPKYYSHSLAKPATKGIGNYKV